MAETRTATQSSSESQINAINLWMRGQPWYQQWFAARGLNPNRVQLSDNQRRELTEVAARNGVALGDRMKFDAAGNVNQQGGWAGLPTWAKVAIGSGVTAASLGAIPGVPGIPGLNLFGGNPAGYVGSAVRGTQAAALGGGAAPGLAASVGAPAATEAAIFGGAGGGAAAGGGLGGLWPSLLAQLGGSAVQGILGARSAQHAADTQVEAAREARAYLEPLYEQARGTTANLYNQSAAYLHPYASQGENQMRALHAFVGIPYTPSAAPTFPMAGGGGPVPLSSLAPASAAPTPAAPAGMVLLEAPTGQRKAVPADQVAFYEARGAKRV